MALAAALPVTTLAGVLFGVGLDRAFGTGWFVTAVLGGLGFAAGVHQLFRGLKQQPPP